MAAEKVGSTARSADEVRNNSLQRSARQGAREPCRAGRSFPTGRGERSLGISISEDIHDR